MNNTCSIDFFNFQLILSHLYLKVCILFKQVQANKSIHLAFIMYNSNFK